MPDHPSADQRVYLMLKALERMDDNHQMHEARYAPVIERLRTAWRSCLADAGQAAGPAPADADRLDRWFDDLYRLINTELSVARYRGWARAVGLVPKLRGGAGRSPTPAGEDRLADVLNAAWLGRLEIKGPDQSAVDRVGERALVLCRQIVERDDRSG